MGKYARGVAANVVDCDVIVNDFQTKLNEIKQNIEHNKGFPPLEECLKERISKLPTEVKTTLMYHLLTWNNLKSNGRYFLEVKSFAMVTISAPLYATIYMGNFEDTYIYTEIKNSCLFYVRYIDDILGCQKVEKTFSRVPTNQGRILALVYQ